MTTLNWRHAMRAARQSSQHARGMTLVEALLATSIILLLVVLLLLTLQQIDVLTLAMSLTERAAP